MAEKAVILTIYIFTFLTGLPSNLLACYTFLVKVRRKPAPIDILLLNLTVSDLILLVFLPFKMVEAASDMTWPLPPFLCPLTNFCFYSSIYLSTLFLMAVSVERYLCVAYPVKYKLNQRPVYTIAVSFFFWLIVYSHISIVYIVQNHNDTLPHIPDNFNCYDKFTPSQLRILLPFRLELCVVLFFLPFLITFFCYVNIIHILASLLNVQPHKKQRAVGLAVATLLNFAICFAPYNISHIVGFVQNKSPTWRVEVFSLSALNTVLDPVVFFFSSTAIQKTVTDRWGSLCTKLRAAGSPCSPPCCKTQRKDVGEAGADQVSESSHQKGLTVAERHTEATFDHSPKSWEIKAPSTLPRADGTMKLDNLANCP